MAAAVTYSKSSSFMAELKALYVSPPVQRIRFRFGPVQILPADFRYLALKLGAKESWVSIHVDPTTLETHKALADMSPNAATQAAKLKDRQSQRLICRRQHRVTSTPTWSSTVLAGGGHATTILVTSPGAAARSPYRRFLTCCIPRGDRSAGNTWWTSVRQSAVRPTCCVPKRPGDCQ